MNVVTRFAPSPTGFLHIGGVRTGLYAWLLARQNGGTFILRIDDTDKVREVEGSIVHIQECLKWIGIDWDYGPDKPGPWGSNIESERLSSYKAAAQKLYEAGLAYPDPFGKEELEVMRQKAQDEKRPFLVRELRPTVTAKWDGKSALRFKHPEIARFEWDDAVRGRLSAGPEALDDLIIMKADGYPTYNFAHIVDDREMGVTHVFRADEFISSTPNYIALYKALGIEPPIFATLPPILREDRIKKLGKRDGAKDTLDYRDEGYLPEALANYLALIGWNPGGDQEVFSYQELMQKFSVDRIHKAGAAFDEIKLKWFNREHMMLLPESEFVNVVTPFLTPETSEFLKSHHALASVLRERLMTLGEIGQADRAGEYSWILTCPTPDKEMLVKKESAADTATRLEHVKELIKGVGEWDKDTVKAAVWPYAEAEGKAQVLWPLRVALSGRTQSPDPFIIAGIIGYDDSLSRIDGAIAVLRAAS